MSGGTESQRSLWAFVPAALMTAMVGGLLTMAAIARSDPGFALEPDYYAKAVHWDQQQAQLAANRRLGWRLEAALEPQGAGHARVTVRLTDGADRPITGAAVQLEAFANARAAARIDRALEEQPGGRYSAELPIARTGLWELRFSARHGADRFTQQLRLEIPRGARP